MTARASLACMRAGVNPFGDDGRGVNRSVRGMVRALYRKHKRENAGDALVWEGRGDALGGWLVAIMRAPRGDPRLPEPAAGFTDPASAVPVSGRDWPQ